MINIDYKRFEMRMIIRKCTNILRWKFKQLRAVLSGFNNQKSQMESQIVICGFPRSGTSLLFNVIAGILNGHEAYTGPESILSKEVSFKSKILDKGCFITKQPADIFNLKNIKDWNLRKKKLVVFVCIRDLLVSRHQMIPDKYYMDFDTRLNALTGEKMNVGIKHFYLQVKELMEHGAYDCDIHFIYYEKLLKNPNIISDILKCEGLNVSRDAIDYASSSKLPYTSEDKISKGHESEGIKERKPKWQTNDNDSERVKECFNKNPELAVISKYFGYESA